MSSKRSSKIWAMPKEEFKTLVENATTYKEVLNYFGFENKGNNFKTVKKRINEDQIDFSHFKPSKAYLTSALPPITFDKVLTQNSNYNRSFLKKRLLDTKLLNNKCYCCGQLPEWKGKKLSLQLDHINGISNDNRLENLRILCPNCHSQTESFAGKNKRSPG
jgi:5-methylcytosine-specific restriction endonuclease McrA